MAQSNRTCKLVSSDFRVNLELRVLVSNTNGANMFMQDFFKSVGMEF